MATSTKIQSLLDPLREKIYIFISGYSTTIVHGTWKRFSQTRPSSKKNLSAIVWYARLRKNQIHTRSPPKKTSFSVFPVEYHRKIYNFFSYFLIKYSFLVHRNWTILICTRSHRKKIVSSYNTTMVHGT